MTCIGFANPASGGQDLSAADRIVHAISEIKVGHLLNQRMQPSGRGESIRGADAFSAFDL